MIEQDQPFRKWLRFSFCGCGAILALLLAPGCEKPAIGWKAFSPPGGRFTVLMPGAPVEQIPKTNTGLEAKKYSIVTAMSHISGLAVAYADQPNRPDVQTDPKKLLDLLRDQAVIDLRGQLLSEQSISLQGSPGRELKVAIPGGFTALARIYLVKKRLYTLIVIAGSKGLTSPEAQKFLNSFQVLQDAALHRSHLLRIRTLTVSAGQRPRGFFRRWG